MPSLTTILAALAYRVGGLPLSALLFLACGVILWWAAAAAASILASKSRKYKGKMPLFGWLLPFLCTALGGCLLFLFCEDSILGCCALFGTALLYALPLVWRMKGGDGR